MHLQRLHCVSPESRRCNEPGHGDRVAPEIHDAAAAEEFSDEMDKLRVLSGVKQFPMRVKCATLAWHTINAAIHDQHDATTE